MSEPRRGARHGKRWSWAGAAAVLAALLALTAAPGTATAADRGASAAGPDRLQVDLLSLEPLAPKPGDTLTITGTVTNTGIDPVRTVSVRLRMSPTGLSGRGEIADVVDGSTQRDGTVVGTSSTILSRSLAGGEAVPFTISLPINSLGLPAHTPSVRVLHVEALGDAVAGDGAGPDRLGLTRTFLPWFPDPTVVTPTKVVWLWPLTDTPAVDAAGVQLTDALGVSVSAQGRLQRLLTLAALDPTAPTYVVDPALAETVESMTGGYQVAPVGRPQTAGTHAAAAQTWLGDLRTTLKSTAGDSVAMPYADPDIVAMNRAGLNLDLTRGITTAAQRTAAATGTQMSGTLVWPSGGRIDATTLDALRAAGARTVLLSAEALPPAQEQNHTLDGVAPLGDDGQAKAVLADPGVAAALTMPTATPAQALLARQRLLAEVAQVTVDEPSLGTTIVAAPPTRWDPDLATTGAWLTALQSSPWMTSSSLASLLALPAASSTDPPRLRADYPALARRGELPQPYLSRIAARRAQLRAMSAITSNPTDPSDVPYEDALDRAQSAAWRDDPFGANRLLTDVGKQLDTAIAAVRVVSRNSVTLASERGVVPITIANDLTQPVRVGLRLTGQPSVRFVSSPYPAVTVPPGARVSVEVPAQVIGAGDVEVRVQLLTPDGRLYGQPVTLAVRSTAYAEAAQWVVTGLVVALAGLLAFRLFGRWRRRTRKVDEPVVVPSAGGPE